MGIGPSEMGLILLAVLIIFGAGQLGSVGTALGRGIRDFRRELEGRDEDKGTSEQTSAERASKASSV